MATTKKPSISFTDIKNPALREEAEKQYRKQLEEEAKKQLEEQTITNEILTEQNEIIKKSEVEKKELRKKYSDKSIESIKTLHNTIKEEKEKTKGESKQSLKREKVEIPMSFVERLEKSNSVIGRSIADGINAGNRAFWSALEEVPVFGAIVETLKDNADELKRERGRELAERSKDAKNTSSRLIALRDSISTNLKALKDKILLNLSGIINVTSKLLSPLNKTFANFRELINTSKTNQRLMLGLEKLSASYHTTIKDIKASYKSTLSKLDEVKSDITTSIALRTEMILEPMKKGWTNFTTSMKDSYTKSTSSLKEHFAGISKSYEKLSEKVTGGFKWLAARNFITSIIANAPMLLLLGGFAFGIYQIITKIDDLWNMLKDFGSWIGEKIIDAFNWVKDGLIDLWSNLKLGLFKAIDLIPGVNMGDEIKKEKEFQKGREEEKIKAFNESDAGKMKLLEDRVRESTKKRLEEMKNAQQPATSAAPVVMQSNSSKVNHVQSAPSAGRQYTLTPKVAVAGFH